MLELKLNHVSKRGPLEQFPTKLQFCVSSLKIVLLSLVLYLSGDSSGTTPTLNSQNTPYISPLQASYEVWSKIVWRDWRCDNRIVLYNMLSDTAEAVLQTQWYIMTKPINLCSRHMCFVITSQIKILYQNIATNLHGKTCICTLM